MGSEELGLTGYWQLVEDVMGSEELGLTVYWQWRT